MEEARGGKLTVREARPGDELAVAELHVRSWREAYRELMPTDFLAALDPRDRASDYEFEAREPEAPTTLLAVLSETILGFTTFRSSRDADAVGLGEIQALYVDPDRQEGGVGRLLMAAARRQLRERGFTECILWVLRGNTRAHHFYEREGWSPDGAEREENPYGIVSNVIRFRRRLN